MKGYALCPACGRKLSVWSIMSAPTLFHMRCPACRCRYRVRGWTLRGTIATVIGGLALSVLLVVLYREGIISELSVIGIAFGVLVALEILISLLICSRGTLEVYPAKGGSSPPPFKGPDRDPPSGSGV